MQYCHLNKKRVKTSCGNSVYCVEQFQKRSCLRRKEDFNRIKDRDRRKAMNYGWKWLVSYKVSQYKISRWITNDCLAAAGSTRKCTFIYICNCICFSIISLSVSIAHFPSVPVHLSTRKNVVQLANRRTCMLPSTRLDPTESSVLELWLFHVFPKDPRSSDHHENWRHYENFILVDLST